MDVMPNYHDKKLIAINACYYKQHFCVYLQLFHARRANSAVK